MRITPGEAIPFWLKIANGEGSRFIVAHLTSLQGVQQMGSPYDLTYTGARGIYTGTGPVMGLNNLVVDYEVYMDEDHTLLDNAQLPNLEVMESDISNSTVLSGVLGAISGISPDVVTVNLDETLTYTTQSISGGFIAEIELGEIEQGTMITTEDQGIVDQSMIQGEVT